MSSSCHEYEQVHFSKPTWCDECSGFFASPFGKQGLRCKICNKTSHSKCLAAAMARPCLKKQSVSSSSSSTLPSAPSSSAPGSVTPPRTTDERHAFSKTSNALIMAFFNEDLMGLIFNYLSISQQANIRLVCHRFARFGRRYPFTHLDLSGCALHVTADSLPLSQFSRVIELSLSSCVRLGSRGIVQVLDACRSLRSLNLSFLRGHLGSAELISCLPLLSSLTSLDVSHTDAAFDTTLLLYAPVLPICLTSLKIGHYITYDRATSTKAMEALVARCTRLQVLDLSDRLSIRSMVERKPLMLESLSPLWSLKRLHTLRLPTAVLPPTTLVALGDAIHTFEQVNDLPWHEPSPPLPLGDLHWDNLQVLRIPMLTLSAAKAIERMPFLRRLQYDRQWNDEPNTERVDADRAVQMLRKHAGRLEELSIGHSRDSPGQTLACLVENQSRLEILRITCLGIYNHVTHEDLMVICTHCPRLKELRLVVSHNQEITAATMTMIATTLTALRVLRIDSGDGCLATWEFKDKCEPLLALLAASQLTCLEELGLGGGVHSSANGALLAALPRLERLPLSSSARPLKWSAIFQPSLSFASLRQLYLRQERADVLLQAVRACPRLEELEWSPAYEYTNKSESISLQQWREVLRYASRFVSLRIETGYRWKFDDLCCAAIASSCPHLRYLAIFPPRGSASVADGIEYHYITDQGVRSIINGCPLLLLLAFDSCKVHQLPELPLHLTIDGWVDPQKRAQEIHRLRHAHVGTHGGPCVMQ